MNLPRAGLLTKVTGWAGFLATSALAGCGGGSQGQSPPPTPEPTAVIFVSSPPSSLAVNASATLQAAAIFPNPAIGVVNNSVTWTITCGSTTACGTFGTNDNVAAVTYTAPSAIPTGATVTVTATSVADGSKSISAQITIVAPMPISVSILSPPASLQVNAQYSIDATVANDVSASPEVTWTAACGTNTSCGSFNPTSTRSGVGTTYTAPATAPSGGNVTVTATSVTDPTKSFSTTIAITAATPTLANGTYVFQVSGQPGSQAAFVTGVLVANNGQITGGEQDSIAYGSDADNDVFGNPTFQTITGGSYTVTADGNLQISIAIAPYEMETLTGTLVGTGSRGFVAGLNGAAASGTLDLQTSVAAPSGGYAVSLSGGDGFGESAWVGGVVNIDGPGAISGAGSVLDVITSQAFETGTFALGASTVSAPDAQGRVRIQLQQAANSALLPIELAGYIIDATHIRLIETGDTDDGNNFDGVLGGLALGQGNNTGQFSAASLADINYVFGAQGNDSQGSLQVAGVLTANANGSVTGTLNWNDRTGTATQNPLPFTGTYTVDPTGRVTLSQLADGATFHYSMHLYLAAGGNALLLSNDSADNFEGQAFQQQTAPFAAASFNGLYGLNATLFTSDQPGGVYGPTPVIGSITAVSGSASSSVSGFADRGPGGPDFAVTGSFNAAANGVFNGTLAGLSPGSPAAVGSFTLYVIDGTQAIMIETDPSQLSLAHLENAQ